MWKLWNRAQENPLIATVNIKHKDVKKLMNENENIQVLVKYSLNTPIMQHVCAKLN